MAPALVLKAPATTMVGASRSAFTAGTSFRQLAVARTAPAAAPAAFTVEAASGRTCQFTGKKANNGWMVSFSHRRNKKLQHVNVQETRLCWEKENRWVRVNVAAKTLRTISKLGLDEVAKRYNVDLYSLPYSDIGSNRSEWLAANNKPPTKKNKRAMKHEAPKAEA